MASKTIHTSKKAAYKSIFFESRNTVDRITFLVNIDVAFSVSSPKPKTNYCLYR